MPGQIIGALALAFGLLCSLLRAEPADRLDAEAPTTRAVGGSEMETLRGYSRQMGKDLLKESLGLDLDQWQLQWNARTRAWSAGAKVISTADPDLIPGLGAENKGVDSSGFGIKLEQSDDLQRFLLDRRDLPFGVELSGSFVLGGFDVPVQTKVWLPLSWKDEMRAEASMPIGLFGATQSLWWRGLGLGRTLSLRSDYRNRLGLSQIQAGVGTRWDRSSMMGAWDLDYDYRVLLGQGSDQAIHWLKLSRPF